MTAGKRGDEREASSSGLQQWVARRTALLKRLFAVLSSDERVLACWLSGSHGRAEDDEWSDFDLHVAVEDGAFAGFLEDRPALYAMVARPILVQPEMPSDNLSLGDAVYQLVYFDGGILVDWNCGPASKATKPIGHRLLFEKRPFPVAAPPALSPAQLRAQAQRWTTFFWAMAPIAVKYAARGSTRQAAAQTDLLARALICLHRLLIQQDPTDPWLEWLNRPLEDEIDAVLPRTGPAITPEEALAVVGSQCRVMLALHGRLTPLGVDVHPEMAIETENLVRLASEAIAQADFPTRRYR